MRPEAEKGTPRQRKDNGPLCHRRECSDGGLSYDNLLSWDPSVPRLGFLLSLLLWTVNTHNWTTNVSYHITWQYHDDKKTS